MFPTGKYLVALMLLLFSGAALRVHVVARTPALSEYDPHFGYIEEIRAHYAAALAAPGEGRTLAQKINAYSFPALMRASLNPLRWHPPAYHVLCALAGALYPRASAVPVKLFSLLCNFLTIWLLYLLLRHFFRDDYELILPGLALLLFLPGHIVFSNTASNDVLLVPAVALFVLLSLRWGSALSGGRVLTLGLLCAFLLLIKYTGLICFFYLNALLLYSLSRAEITPARYARFTLLAWAVPLALAGWFYWANYSICGNPVYMTGLSQAREHSFLSFDFPGLLSSKVNNWHESGSVLTGFFASFYSFDWINMLVWESGFRNAVFCLALVPLLLSGAGLLSGAAKKKYFPLNLFLLLSVLSVVKLLWKFHLGDGVLKSCYVMFLAPLLPVYFAQACSAVRTWNRTAFHVCLAEAALLSLTVAAYYYRFFVAAV